MNLFAQPDAIPLTQKLEKLLGQVSDTLGAYDLTSPVALQSRLEQVQQTAEKLLETSLGTPLADAATEAIEVVRDVRQLLETIGVSATVALTILLTRIELCRTALNDSESPPQSYSLDLRGVEWSHPAAPSSNPRQPRGMTGDGGFAPPSPGGVGRIEIRESGPSAGGKQRIIVPETSYPPRPAPTVEATSVPVNASDAPDFVTSRQYRVWFGTDRNKLPAVDGIQSFGGDWSSQLTYGSCLAYVPKTHEFGEIGSSWISRQFARLVGREDDRVTLREINDLNEADFSASLADALHLWTKRTALVFVHGYNVDFNQAAIRAAQIGFDLRVDGVTAFFSWPSKGTVQEYTRDMASIDLSEQHFLDFLTTLSNVPWLEEINILAHSMGNRLVCRTIDRLVGLRTSGALRVPVGHLILAAADLTADFFHQYAARYPQLAQRRITNYTCDADMPLKASQILSGLARVGLEPPVFTHAGIDTVSASRMDLDILGHSYFAAAEPLLYDIAELIHHDRPPSQRLRLQPALTNNYWILAP